MKDKNYYEERIIKALDFINKNLHNEITIDEVSKRSHFSSFHFQRIYKTLLGETPYETILRLRLEKSIFIIKNESQLSLKTIATNCGFSSYENFSRQFKERFKCSPNQFKKDKRLQNSRIYQEYHPNDYYHRIAESRKQEVRKFKVVVENLPEIKIAFVRAIFGADGSGLIEKYHHLIEWAEKNQIKYQGERKRFGMSIDSVEVTPASKFRYDFALALEKMDKKSNGIIEFGAIPKGEYATIHCIGKLEDVAQASDYLYKKWLPESGYKPMNHPALEEFIKGPEEIGWENFNIKCRIPIEKI